jgi:hypothetical protein
MASEENDNDRINLIPEEDWTKHYKDLLYKDTVDLMNTMSEQDEQAILCEELKAAIKNSKNRKSEGLDSIPTELWKYSGKKKRRKSYYISSVTYGNKE